MCPLMPDLEHLPELKLGTDRMCIPDATPIQAVTYMFLMLAVMRLILALMQTKVPNPQSPPGAQQDIPRRPRVDHLNRIK
jgi:hypothetical protein